MAEPNAVRHSLVLRGVSLFIARKAAADKAEHAADRYQKHVSMLSNGENLELSHLLDALEKKK